MSQALQSNFSFGFGKFTCFPVTLLSFGAIKITGEAGIESGCTFNIKLVVIWDSKYLG